MDSVELELSVTVTMTCEPIVHTPECFFFKICFLFFF